MVEEPTPVDTSKKRRRALASYVITGVVLALFVAAACLAYIATRPPRPVSWERDPPFSESRWSCRGNLTYIAAAARMYAEDNDGWCPERLEQLYPGYIDNQRALRCTREPGTYYDAEGRRHVGNKRDGFILERGLRFGVPEGFILAYCSTSHPMERHRWRPVVYVSRKPERKWSVAGISGAWWPEECEAEFQRKLAAQREAVKRWREAGAKKEDMDKFFGSFREK